MSKRLPLETRILCCLADGQPHTPLQLRRHLNAGNRWRGPSIGALYAAIDRLEAQGLVETWSAPGGEERGFRPQLWVRRVEGGTLEPAEERAKMSAGLVPAPC